MTRDRKERMWFIRLWANYVRTHPDKEWSAQQRILIDSQFQNAQNYPLTKEEYLEIKRLVKGKQH